MAIAATGASATSADRAVLLRRANRLAWLTIAYNTLEGVVAVAAGVAAGSVALISFGLDSAVEVASAVAVAWQTAGRGLRAVEREHRTMRLIGYAFLLLAGYVAVHSVAVLAGAGDPDPSPVGLGLAAVSLLVMPWLAVAKRRVGRRLGSLTVLADSTQTVLCASLSGVLLVGLALNAAFGWTWADPVAGLVIAAVAAKEGRDALRGDPCCA